MKLRTYQLREYIIKMSGLTEHLLSLSVNKHFNIEEVLKVKNQIIQYYNSIEQLSITLLSKENYSPNEIRTILGIIKINNILKHITESCFQIKKHTQDLKYNYPKLDNLKEIVRSSLKKSIDALIQEDTYKALEVIRDQNEFIEVNLELKEEFFMAMHENHTDDLEGFNALWISYSLEQIGNLSIKISQEIIFIIFGEDKIIENNNTEENILDISKYLKKFEEKYIGGTLP